MNDGEVPIVNSVNGRIGYLNLAPLIAKNATINPSAMYPVIEADETEKKVIAWKLKTVDLAEDPKLGLATTRQLYEELKNRGQMGEFTRQFDAGYLTMFHLAEVMLTTLSEDILNYRTVDYV